MFTGIVEEVGVVHRIDGNQDGIEISIQAKKILDDLKVDDSVSCSGICLTVTDVNKNLFTVQLVKETLSRTTAKHWKNNSIINLERALLPSTRMGGHFVQGHIDCTLEIENIKKVKWNRPGGLQEVNYKVSKPIEKGTYKEAVLIKKVESKRYKR